MKVSYVRDKNGKYHKIEDSEHFSKFSGSVKTQRFGNFVQLNQRAKDEH